MFEQLPFTSHWLLLVCAVVAAVLLLATVRWLRRSPPAPDKGAPDLFVNVGQLDDRGPPSGDTRLEFYGTPVRIAVIVLAPSGRTGELPPPDVVPGLIERLVPGLTDIVAEHQPLVRRWPAQLSSHGFSQSFFNNVALPGKRGKGTPWCSIAGKLAIGDRQFLVGLVFSSGSPNGLGQFEIEHDGQWLDVLRIRQ